MTCDSADQEGQAPNLAPTSSGELAAWSLDVTPTTAPTTAVARGASRAAKVAAAPHGAAASVRCRPAWADPAGSRGMRASGPDKRRDGEQRVRGRAQRAPRTRRRHARRPPRPRDPLPATSPSRPPRLPRATDPDPLPCLLLPSHPDARPLPACRRPASGPPLHAWAAPRFIWQVEEGGSSAKRWTPLPRKPSRDAKSGPEAGRRPGDLLRPPARDHQQETTTPTRGHLCSPAAWPLRPWALGRPNWERSLRFRVHAGAGASDQPCCAVALPPGAGASPRRLATIAARPSRQCWDGRLARPLSSRSSGHLDSGCPRASVS